MQSAIEKLREYRDTGYRSPDEIIKLWTNILCECDLSILGDEKWLVLEQVFKSSLLCSNSYIAHQCLEQLNEHFQKTSPASITLNAMYFEFIGEFDKTKQIISTLLDDNEILDDNETNDIKKLIYLIKFLVHICKRSYDIPSSCLSLIECYCQKMTEVIINDNALDDIRKSLNEIKHLLKSINLNDVHKDKIDLILDHIDSCFLRLSVCYYLGIINLLFLFISCLV
jgi:hypothetical protein